MRFGKPDRRLPLPWPPKLSGKTGTGKKKTAPAMSGAPSVGLSQIVLVGGVPSADQNRKPY